MPAGLANLATALATGASGGRQIQEQRQERQSLQDIRTAQSDRADRSLDIQEDQGQQRLDLSSKELDLKTQDSQIELERLAEQRKILTEFENTVTGVETVSEYENFIRDFDWDKIDEPGQQEKMLRAMKQIAKNGTNITFPADGPGKFGVPVMSEVDEEGNSRFLEPEDLAQVAEMRNTLYGKAIAYERAGGDPKIFMQEIKRLDKLLQGEDAADNISVQKQGSDIVLIDKATRSIVKRISGPPLVMRMTDRKNNEAFVSITRDPNAPGGFSMTQISFANAQEIDSTIKDPKDVKEATEENWVEKAAGFFSGIVGRFRNRFNEKLDEDDRGLPIGPTAPTDQSSSENQTPLDLIFGKSKAVRQ